MKNKISVFCLIILAFSCSERHTKNDFKDESSSSDLISDTSTISAESPKFSNVFDSTLTLKSYRLWYKTVKQPVVFSEKSRIYSKPDTLSNLVATINFDSEISPIDNSQISTWTQILHKNDTCYIQTKDICFYSFPSNTDTYKYFLRESENITTVYKYHLKNRKFIDSTNIKFGQPDNLKVFVTRNWKNTDALFMLNRDGACCGCSNSQYYIIDANNKFDSLSFTNQWIDDGEGNAGYESSLSIPFYPKNDFVKFIEYEYSNYPTHELTQYDKPKHQFRGDTVRYNEKTFKWDGVKLEKVDNTVYSK